MRGGYGSGERRLGDRVAASTVPPVVPDTPARHCYVEGHPSLLVEWCRTERGWEGRVVSVLWLDAVGWAVVERWLPAGEIERRD